MAFTLGRSFLLQPCSYSSSTFHNKIYKPSLGSATSFPSTSSPRCYRQVSVQAQQRPTWLPGLDPPSYLDGTLPGDYGFDPLGLGENPESLKWYVQAELVHSRFAMAGVAGILFTDLLRVTGINKLPVWYEAGAVKFDFASTTTLIVVQVFLMGFAETKRYMDFISPGSQAKEGSFFGLESALEGLEPGPEKLKSLHLLGIKPTNPVLSSETLDKISGLKWSINISRAYKIRLVGRYPGGPLLNPLGLAKDVKSAHEWKLKEIKNGRLAMMAMLGIFVQASVTHAGPIDNLVEHLSNPWQRTIIQTLANNTS